MFAAASEAFSFATFGLTLLLVREFSTPSPETMLDVYQLQQVILNLLLNALEAMGGLEDRPRRLVIRTERDAGDCARLIVQDSGFTGGDACTHLAGVGCPASLTPILEQAWLQGARIHSNSWGDLQGRYPGGPTANYPQSARDVDAFVWSHPDMLVVFNTGNYGPRPEARNETTPLLIDGVLYTQAGTTRNVVALDPKSGHVV